MTTKPNNSGLSKMVLIAIIVVAVLPVLAGTLLYISGWKPNGKVNYGELITPPRPVTDIALQTQEGKPASFKSMHGKWVMVYVDSSACLDSCPKSLYAIRQIHTAQGKEADRIKRVFIATDNTQPASLQAQKKLYPDMEIWIADASALPQLNQAFALQAGTVAHRSYLIDPLGNVMMQYAPQADPAGIRKDLARLLSYSWTG
ncbi:MAG TPA: SCO family protein [Methylophilaceae bacterium]|jgi:cytochrome oxidase Cu insertion factor (SCO1/SenC/PrrC family)